MRVRKERAFAFSSLVFFSATILNANFANAQDAANAPQTPIEPQTPSAPTPAPVTFGSGNFVITPSGAVAVPVAIAAPIIPNSGAQALQLGLAAASNRNWGELRRLISVCPDENIKKALIWRLVSDDLSDAGFYDSKNALDTLSGFPELRNLRIRVEKRIETYGLNPQARIDFLKRSEPSLGTIGPISGEGQMALAQAYIELGNIDAARPLISQSWRTHRFDSNLQQRYLDRFGAYLTPEDHDARVSFLLWAERTSQARLLIDKMSDQGRANFRAHLGIQTGEGAVLSGAMIDDRGIKYERVKNLRRQDRNAEALNLLLTIDSNGLPEPGQESVWTERRILLIEAIRSARWQDAYRLVSQHGLTSGSKFADAEFSAGWIALRFLNQPDVALRHFQRFEAAVQTNMSKSRGIYWMGRTYEAMGNQAQANAQYQIGANYPTFYYGQLSAARLATINGTEAILRLPPEAKASQADWDKINARPMMQIAKTLSDISERDLFVKFCFALDDTLETNGEHQALSEFARSKNENLVGIRVAKAGLNRGIVATEAAFPIIPIPRIVGYNQAEDAFTLAITRQETEFNPNAVSRAGARGLMQFMPATAIAQARRMELPHQTAWLTSRPQHNLTLGSAHLADLTNRFYGSYVLAIISYNAGPGRASQWIDTYGEIRAEDIDKVIDWVEEIPFSETRNYVQRVMENIQVYRARLNNDAAPLQIYQDLMRGTKPPPMFDIKVMPGAEQPGGPPPVEPQTTEDPAKTENQPAP